MSETEPLDESVREALNKRGWTNEEISTMTAAKMFDEYCNWHGLIHWGPILRTVYENAKRTAKKTVPCPPPTCRRR